MWVDVDLNGNTLQKKIRMRQIKRYDFIFGECSLDGKSFKSNMM